MDNSELSQLYELGAPTTEYSFRFKSNAISYSVKFLPGIFEIQDMHFIIANLFDHIIKTIMDKVKTDQRDLVGIQIDHPSLYKPIMYPFVSRRQFSGANLVNLIERVIQSQEELNFDEEMRIKVVVIHLPRGGSKNNYRQRIHTSIKQWLKMHMGHGGSIIEISNSDNLCLPRAIAVGIAYVNKNDPAYFWNSIIRGDKNRTCVQKKKAKELMTLAGMCNHAEECGIPELEKIQAACPRYQIKLYDEYKKLIYSGPQANDIIHLLYYNSHYFFVKSMPIFVGKNRYCDKCEKGYEHQHEHRCLAKCACCHQQGACLPNNNVLLCQLCNRRFMNQQCFDKHKEIRNIWSVCLRFKRCIECGKLIDHSRVKNHVCGYEKCRKCREFGSLASHQCYMTKFIPPDLPAHFKFIFFDFEATQDREFKESKLGSTYQHEINLAIAQTVCELCWKSSLFGECVACRQHIFYNRDSFCEWLFSTENRGAIAIAHFMKGYDGQFLLQYLYTQGIIPKIVTKGSTLMSIEVPQAKIKIIDSINFFGMPLSALPKTFDFGELKKGYFPHLFNTKQNAKYIGIYPDAYYYGPANMKPGDREQFYQWYNKQIFIDLETQTMKIFNFQVEFEQYCISDVDILRRCCMKFRDDFLQQHGIDPFDSITIASACNKVYRYKYLKSKMIGIVPHMGYRRNDIHSVTAIKWLKYISHRDNIQIIHAENGGECRIPPYKVDGICGTNIYEFYGCRWHGCSQCMPKRQQLCADHRTSAEDAYQKTLDRKEYLERLGYNVIEMWQHDYENEKKTNDQMKMFIDNIDISDPLNPRSALYGGRVNAIKLYHKCSRGEKIRYYDVVSLYPYINKYARYPVGHPIITTENFTEIQNYEGIAKCVILPPRNLYHPVLPYRVDKKLLFPLCRLCAEEKKRECSHTDKERVLTGVWVIGEILKAIEKGYKIIKIYEIWHYNNTETYHPVTNPEGGMFSGYVNANLKIKQESDGWPQWVQTEHDKNRYINEYFEKEGVLLDKSKIAKNPGHRMLSKTMLNSLWGKFGQRNNQRKTEHFSDFTKFCKLITDPAKEILGVNYINDKLVAVTFCDMEEMVEVMSNTNVVIAAYTTAFARLKLYSILEKLDNRVLYFDTDSVIFTTKPGQWEPSTGSYLGDLSDELKNYPAGSYISTFVSGGPKNYAMEIRNAFGKHIDEICKVRGFTLSSVNQKRINFKTMCQKVKSYVKDKIAEEINIVYPKIVRENRNVITVNVQRKYKINYDKRILLNDFLTLPYGY